MHRLSFLLLLGFMAGAGCQGNHPPPDFVARVGNTYLMQSDLDAALVHLANPIDTLEARRQVIEQWVTNELLYQEALRRNLREDREVQRRLHESERAVLIDALVSRHYSEEEREVDIPPSEIRSYFEQHKEHMRLREPFVRVRLLSTTQPDSAEAARALLIQLTDTTSDSPWSRLVHRFSDETEDVLALSQTYYPESRLFATRPALREALARLEPGETTPVLNQQDTYYVLQLVDRVPAGTIPELGWVEEEVVQLLTLETRKQMFQRQVQRLRTEAQARDALVIR